MFVRIGNTPRDYAWGDRTALAELLGRAPSGAPEAELWLGAHEGSPSQVLDPAVGGGCRTLDEFIAADPMLALGRMRVIEAEAAGRAPRLPFLLKVLAAAAPLSLQAHPSSAQARAGFARENAQGIPLDDPRRNYQDDQPKPEIIVALEDGFEALCGFRSAAAAAADFDLLGVPELAARLRAHPSDEAALRAVTRWLLEPDGDAVAAVVAAVVAGANRVADSAADAPRFAAVRFIAAQRPSDPGIAVALLLNHVALRRGEALYLPAGNIHAYLSGVGVELMTASDNVLRGGLTPKHVDVPELLEVLDFAPLPVPFLAAVPVAPGVESYRPGGPDFALAHVVVRTDSAAGPLPLPSAAIAIAVAGPVHLAGAGGGSLELARGEAVFITPDELALTFTGAGEVFVATANPSVATTPKSPQEDS